MSGPVRVVIPRSVEDEVRRGLAIRGETAVDLLVVDPDGTGTPVGDADGVLRWDLTDAGFRSVLDRASRLRWAHSPGAGVESWPLAELARRGVTLTNAAGVFAVPLAEWVLAVMLRVVKRSDAVQRAQDAQRWAPEISSDELFAKTLLVLGTGGIATEIIRRAEPFGMRIWAANRSGRAVAGAERVVTGDGWRALLPQVDFLVSTVPATPETRLMIGSSELVRLPSDAWLINVGRGATIDEPALYRALADGTIAGAALDAFTTEPLPPGHPAWTTPNLIVSPHSAGSSDPGRSRGLTLFVDNACRFAYGSPLRNVVDLHAGY